MYRSARFLPIIEANLDVLAGMPDVELLVSDRHGLDDALGRLQARYGADPRFRFFAATDGIDWVAHYNWLLKQGRGTYFAWMPHDDDFPTGYYAGLADHLDANPDTLLAFGPIVAINMSGEKVEWSPISRFAPANNPSQSWKAKYVFDMLLTDPWVPIRGVFRREPIVRADHAIRPSFCNQGADIAWVFGVGLLGPIRFVAVPACAKRIYPESTFRTTMPFSIRSMAGLHGVLVRNTIRYAPSLTQLIGWLCRLALLYPVMVIPGRIKNRLAVRSRFRRVRRHLIG